MQSRRDQARCAPVPLAGYSGTGLNSQRNQGNNAQTDSQHRKRNAIIIKPVPPSTRIRQSRSSRGLKVARLLVISGMMTVMGGSMAMAQNAEEQYLLELINAARENPTAALDRILATRSRNTELTGSLTYWKVNLQLLEKEMRTLPFSPSALAWNRLLAAAALRHSELMRQHQLAGPKHQVGDEPPPPDRIKNSGYPRACTGENLPSIETDLLTAHASTLIDWGPNRDSTRTSDGMLPGRGHRTNMLSRGIDCCGRDPLYDARFYEIGIGIAHGSSGKLYITEDFGSPCDRDPGRGYVVGVVYRDSNHDGVYSMGEGLGGVTVTFQHGRQLSTATSNAWGGYQILLEHADWHATVSGPGIKTPVNDAFDLTIGANKHINFRITEPAR